MFPHVLFRHCLFAVLMAFSPLSFAEERALLVLGDSLSSAYRMFESETWPALLEERLQRTGFEIEVINASRKGETSRGGKERLDQALVEFQPEIVIIALGANDGLRKYPLNDLKANLTQMVAAVRQSGGVPVLVGMKLPPDFDQDYAARFSQVFEQVAAETDTPFVPFLLQQVVGNPDLFLPDRLHPRAEAQPRLLDEVWPAVTAALTSFNLSMDAVQR